MRKRVHITLAVVLVMLAGVIAWQALRLREPVYQGKPLSFWLELSTSHGFTKNPDDREVQAIQQIGTNALPVLLAILRAHDTRFKQVLMTWAQKQKLVQFHFQPADLRRPEAVYGYEVLGPLASTQVPALIESLTKDRSPNVRMSAASALGYIGPEARDAGPALCRAARDTDEGVRVYALWALSQILPDPQLAVPVLVAGIDDTNWFAREAATSALMHYGPAAKAAVPALLRTLTTNRVAASALKAIDPEAAAKAGVE